jgi:DNA-binding transcriptional ArsR family regulator
MISTRLMINAKEAAYFLEMIGTPPRLLIMAHLLEGESSVNALVGKVGISQPSLSQHLGRLRKLGLVDARREGVWIYYYCNSSAVREVFSMLEAFYGEGGAQVKMRPVIAAV